MADERKNIEDAARGPREEETLVSCPRCGELPERWPKACECCHGERMITARRAKECVHARSESGE